MTKYKCTIEMKGVDFKPFYHNNLSKVLTNVKMQIHDVRTLNNWSYNVEAKIIIYEKDGNNIWKINDQCIVEPLKGWVNMTQTFTKRDAIKSLREAAKSEGYLTPDLYIESNLQPNLSWINNYFNTFDDALKEANIFTRKEFDINQSKIQIIKNFKLISLVNDGVVTQALYKKNECKPSVDYIVKHFGWEEMIREANVKPHAQLMSVDDLVSKLRLEIKKLGYIPTRDEYEKLSISPSVDSLSTKGIAWSEAMKKAGYNTYGKTVKVKDRICLEEGCYNQFTPDNDQIYCDNCYKEMRIKLMKKIEKLNSLEKHKEIIRKLTYSSNGDRIIKEILESL